MRLKTMILLALVALAALVESPTRAQDTAELIFTPELTRGLETVEPKFTWSTNPPAQTCAASSSDPAWTGTKAASGNETLAPISESTDYTMACQWGSGETITTATLTWLKQPTYTNGVPMTIARYTIAVGTSLSDVISRTPPASVSVRQHNYPKAESATVTGLKGPATYHFCLRALDVAGNSSDCAKRTDDQSYPAKTIAGTATQSRTISITVDPKPRAATNAEVE